MMSKATPNRSESPGRAALSPMFDACRAAHDTAPLGLKPVFYSFEAIFDEKPAKMPNFGTFRFSDFKM